MACGWKDLDDVTGNWRMERMEEWGRLIYLLYAGDCESTLFTTNSLGPLDPMIIS